MLVVVNLKAGYGSEDILRGITFSADTGETLAILGQNGSGKTTLLHCLGGLLKPRSGDIILAGQNFYRLSPKNRARLVATLPQRPAAPEGLSVLQMTLLGRYPWLGRSGWYANEDYAVAYEAMAKTSCLELSDREFTSLSGGEAQRAFLARALAQKTPLLLLDELAAGLDMVRTAQLFDLLDDQRANGCCVIAVMHDCNMAAIYATRMLGLKNGYVLFDGPVEQVFTEENLSELYGVQIKVFRHSALPVPQAFLAKLGVRHVVKRLPSVGVN